VGRLERGLPRSHPNQSHRGCHYLVLGMMLEYRTGRTTMRSYERTRDQLDAIYASEQLRLAFKGVVVVGY